MMNGTMVGKHDSQFKEGILGWKDDARGQHRIRRDTFFAQKTHTREEYDRDITKVFVLP